MLVRFLPGPLHVPGTGQRQTFQGSHAFEKAIQMIEFPIPELTQGADQSAIVTISDVIDPGFVMVNPDMGQYVMRVSGDPSTDDLDKAERIARARFSEMLGVLRAKKHGRGELQVEIARSHARDEYGNQYVRVGTVKEYAVFPGAMESFASKAAAGLALSPGFRAALRVFGQANRDSAAYYNAYELAKDEFGGRAGIAQHLGVSGNRQDEFRKSANQLSPTEGGRHGSVDPSKATMTLEDLSRFTTDLMTAWINTY